MIKCVIPNSIATQRLDQTGLGHGQQLREHSEVALRDQICGSGATSCSTTKLLYRHLLLVVEEEPEPAPVIQMVPAPVTGSI